MQDSIQESLFSTSRLRGYTDTKEHEQNLSLISSISHKIGLLEIIIRNKIDILLSKENQSWLENLPNNLSFEGDLNTQSRDKFISSQNLGFWLKIADFFRIHNAIFGTNFLDNLDFKKYFEKNKNRFSRKANFRDYHKAQAILLLLRLIRNRAFHFENLYKMNAKGPRLSVKITDISSKSAIISIHPSKIIIFLNDLLKSFDEDLVYYAEKKVAEKDPP